MYIIIVKNVNFSQCKTCHHDNSKLVKYNLHVPKNFVLHFKHYNLIICAIKVAKIKYTHSSIIPVEDLGFNCKTN